MNKQFKKAQKLLSDIKKFRMDCIVRARRGEFWLKDHSEELSKVTYNYNRAKDRVRKLCQIRRFPFWVHIIAHVQMFFWSPLGYIFLRKKSRSAMIDVYWEFKSIKMEWEKDFENTELAIEEDYHAATEAKKTIDRVESYLKKWEENQRKIEALKND